MRAQVQQLVLVWIAGSLTMGTAAGLFLAFPPPNELAWPAITPPAMGGIQPIGGLPLPVRLALLVSLIVLFEALLAIAGRARWSSWLPGSALGRCWWALLVGACGLAGWFFAATVTFGALFPPTLRLVLGYAGGGLPFALVAALLGRSWRLSLAAAGCLAILVATGFFLVAVRAPAQPDAFALSLQYLSYLFGSPAPVCSSHFCAIRASALIIG